jgi:hypothetical protein
MVRLLPLLILIVQIVTIIDVVKSNLDTERKVLWILGIIFLPLLGSLAWYLVSRNVLK